MQGTEYAYRVRGFDGVSFLKDTQSAECAIPAESAGGTINPVKPAATCHSWGVPVWAGLLVLHLVAALIIMDMLAVLLIGNGWRFTVALFVPFALFLTLWFVFDGCRTQQWFPVIVTLITLLTLFSPTLFGPKRNEQMTLT